MAAGSDNQHVSPRTPALGLRFLFLFLLSLVILIIDHRFNHLDRVRQAVSAAVYPLRIVVDAPVSLWRWIDGSMTSRHELQLENSRLNAERLLTDARLQRYAALEAENARLRAMLEATNRVTDQVRVAELLSVSPNPYRHSIVINKGTRDGVYNGQSLIDSDGVVGQVIEAGLLSSQCVLISDPDHALPVEVNRNGLRTIAVGTGEFDRLDLPFLPNNADIEAGDLLVTSGLGGAFPAGYPVAVVDEVIRVPAEPFASVSATPAASLNQVRELMLVWSTPAGPDPDEEIIDDQVDEETPVELPADSVTETDDQAADDEAADEVTTADSGPPAEDGTDE